MSTEANRAAQSAEIAPELVSRIRSYDQDMHDLSFLVNHFVALGLTQAEAERDALTGDLF